MGLKAGIHADIVHGPDELFDLLHDMPTDIDWDDETCELDWLLSFHENRMDFEASLDKLISRLKSHGSWWIACKKGLPKSDSRLGRDIMLENMKAYGWVDVLVCSVNDVWSAYKFVKRKELRNA